MHNYVMVGVGGTGTMLLRPLYTYLAARGDEFKLWLIDGDVVETKNLERQLFEPGDVTVNKAYAAAHGLGAPLGVIEPITDYLSEDNITRYIKNGDTVLICADNFTVRKRIEDHCLTLDTVTVINGGNEKTDGSVQLWVREGGKNITPRIGYLHPEVAIAVGTDRAEMTCAQAAALPGGEQTLIANLQSATWMLTALWRKHTGLHHPQEEPREATWTELQFDAQAGRVDHVDMRLTRNALNA